MEKKKIVIIGGGTGTYTVLAGLKKYPVDLTAIVSMADSGGSNRVIRDEFGLLPTSDIRQCFVALAENNGESERLLAQLFTYRFHQGESIKGMTFGNLFMAALTDILGSQIEAIERTSQILKIKGRVHPVTLDDSQLVAIYEDGTEVVGEHLIDEPEHDGTLKIEKVSLRPEGKVYPEARDAILEADMVVVGPGDLYTSLVSNLVVQGVPEALQKTKAKVVYILNLMTKLGQTHDFGARDHVTVLEKYLGTNCLNTVIVNSQPIPKRILEKYKNQKSYAVGNDLKEEYFKVVKGDIAHTEEVVQVKGDELQRSFVRHDSDKLAEVLCKL